MECVKGRPQPFGAEIRKNHINFAVQVPTGKKCELLLYKKGSINPKYRFEMPEEKGIGEVRFLALQGLDTEKYEYNFQIDEKVWVDPYVRELEWICRSIRYVENLSGMIMTGKVTKDHILRGMM